MSVKEPVDLSPKYAVQLGAPPECVPDAYAHPVQMNGGALESLTRDDLIKAQKEDTLIRLVIKAIETGKWPRDHNLPPKVELMKREQTRLMFREGLLYRVSKRASGAEVSQLVLPSKHVPIILKSMHDSMGHLGIERTTDLVRQRFYWPKISSEIERYIQNCGACITRKGPVQRAPLHQITSSGPMDLVCIDFLSVEQDSKG